MRKELDDVGLRGKMGPVFVVQAAMAVRASAVVDRHSK
jgi:hypothetical protein